MELFTPGGPKADSPDVMIRVGNPNGTEPASFTRFVLPFAYDPRPWHAEGNGQVSPAGACFRELPHPPGGDVWQRTYFTPETAAVIFDRGLWLEMEPWPPCWDRFHVFRGKRALKVQLSAPRLILFEWQRGGESGAQPNQCTSSSNHPDAPPDPLRTGFLVLETWFLNPEAGEDDLSKWTLDDLIVFNEFFRYWQNPWHDETLRQSHCAKSYGSGPTLTTYCDFMAGFQHPGGVGLSACRQNGSSAPRPPVYFERWAEILDTPVIVGGEGGEAPYRIIPRDALDAGTSREPKNRLPSGGDARWFVYSDNRNFLWTCALLEEGGIGRIGGLAHQRGNLTSSGHWVKLVNVDQAGATPIETAGTSAFERKWIAERTYGRWAHFGTLYGFAYHAGAMLGEVCSEPPTWRHFGSMYFDQALLLLYLRVTTFRFSLALARSTSESRDRKLEVDRKLAGEFRDLRRQFAQFTNLYQFPLLSNQQQPVEMYAIQRKIMDVGDLFEEVKAEIESTHEFLEMETQRDQATAGLRLNIVAALGLGMALCFSFLGMSVIVGTKHWIKDPPWWHWVILVAGSLASIGVLLWASSWKWLMNWLDQMRSGKER